MSHLTSEAKLERAKRQIAEGIADLVEAIIERGVAASEWVDQDASPLGKRAHLELARAGTIESRKVNRRVLVRRVDLNRYIEQHGLRRGPEPSEDEEVEDVIERILAGAERPRRGRPRG